MTAALSKRERTRALIIETALTLLRDHAWQDISMNELARAAGLVKGTIFNNFEGGKDEVLAETWKSLCSGWRQMTTTEGGQTLGVPESLLSWLLEQMVGQRNLCRLVVDQSVSTDDDQWLPLGRGIQQLTYAFEPIVQALLQTARLEREEYGGDEPRYQRYDSHMHWRVAEVAARQALFGVYLDEVPGVEYGHGNSYAIVWDLTLLWCGLRPRGLYE